MLRAILQSFERLLCKARGLERKALRLGRRLERLERAPVRFDGGRQPLPFARILKEGELFAASLPESMQKEKGQLKRALVALKYRLEKENGGCNPAAVDPGLVSSLKSAVQSWKRVHEIIEDETLTAHDLLQIQETSRFPEFAALVLDSEEIQEEYMCWTFRDKNLARPFIEFPALQKRLTECNLNGRIGRINPEQLQIVKGAEKRVTLPFEGKAVDILDEKSEVLFRGGWRLTVGEAFEIFKEKFVRAGDLEYMACGIMNWNVQVWGFWNAGKGEYELVDLSHAQWWHQLPLFELVGKEELNKRYNTELDGKQWCAAATATRSARNLNYEGTHAFFELAVPWGDGRYAIFDFGKYALKFPGSFFESLSMFCHNAHATVAYPDENIFYSHRQQAYHPFAIAPEEGVGLMQRIKEDMLRSREKNFVYQIESENCAKWVHEHLSAIVGEEELPNMFIMHLLDTHPDGIVARIFSLIKMLPKPLQTPVLALCHLPLGAAKETWICEEGRFVCKSVTRHHFWRSGMIFLPACFIAKKESGELDAFFSKRWHAFKRLARCVERGVTRLGQRILKRFGRKQVPVKEPLVRIVPTGPPASIIS